MEHEFWHERWGNNQIAFHEGKPNALLTRHISALNLKAGDRVFLPLCGKTTDIGWLMDQGFEVVGAELSEIAIKQLFSEMGITPEIERAGSLKIYSAPDLIIYVGDIFELTPDLLGPVTAVYDRAALVALPDEMRTKYGAHLVSLTSAARQLVITFDYDQSVIPGPPFSVPESTVRLLYDDVYDISQLESVEVEGGLKGKVEATELAWLLS
ncbi:MAG: thiopurine S-methyltransferase [Ponticaulis sp.]|nr:thiopurine S-methyltransferase [Ponticaulis sp.]|tara:strand:- start:15360 stop:15992 length:633 start_codon:yes stop_codon:yes gene_type:complete